MSTYEKSSPGPFKKQSENFNSDFVLNKRSKQIHLKEFDKKLGINSIQDKYRWTEL